MIRSEVAIAPEELTRIRVFNPDADGLRRLQGQSPYLINADLTYDNAEAGTVIKGTELESDEQASDASALIVARGGTIMANGTADDPIIFTAEAGDGSLAMYLRESFAGSYVNSIFVSFPEQAIRIEDVAGVAENDSRYFFEQGTLEIKGNLFYAFGVGGDAYDNTFADLVFDYGTPFKQTLADALAADNAIAGGQPVQSISRQADGGLNPLPTDLATGDAVADLLVAPEDGFDVEATAYAGAFGSTNWAAGWTFLGAAGYF